MLLNGIITAAGLLLDIYGVYDLTLFPAILGLTLVAPRLSGRSVLTKVLYLAKKWL